MKNIILVYALSLCFTHLAGAKERGVTTRKVASVENSQKAAEQIIKALYGRKNDPIISEKSGTNAYEVTIGDGTAANGSATYRVEFKKFNLTGSSSENEPIMDLQITYLSGN